MSEQLHRIKDKIEQLKKLDTLYSLFGSQRHLYKANPVMQLDKIRHFEDAYKLTLPEDYVKFLTEIGNGGVGPFYGLEPFENALFDDLDYQKPDSLLNPSKPFVHTEPWNLDFPPPIEEFEKEKQYEIEQLKFDELYYDKEQMNGTIAICNYGCGVILSLVVNGQEYGNIWTDDRGSCNGIYPSCELGNKDKIGFLGWYELWLDNSLSEIQTKRLKAQSEVEVEQRNAPNKPWWKFW